MASGRIALGCVVALAALAACSNDNGSVLTSGAGGMTLTGSNGSGGVLNGGVGGGVDNCGSDLTGVIRDFQEAHPDFEYEIVAEQGIVQPDLGSDGKPVYAGDPNTGTQSTTGQANFDQWYRDVSGVNISIPLTLTLANNGNGTYTYDNPAFFPIDGQGWDNEGHPHNYHFTYELRTQFRYNGGEVFSFRGDDDLFVFINGRLAIDLGGVHGAIPGSVDLDANAAALGITPGNVYPLDFFFAERHTTESNFRIDTTIDEFVDCGEPIE